VGCSTDQDEKGGPNDAAAEIDGGQQQQQGLKPRPFMGGLPSVMCPQDAAADPDRTAEVARKQQQQRQQQQQQHTGEATPAAAAMAVDEGDQQQQQPHSPNRLTLMVRRAGKALRKATFKYFPALDILAIRIGACSCG
jgi:sRNA-binding protein